MNLEIPSRGQYIILSHADSRGYRSVLAKRRRYRPHVIASLACFHNILISWWLARQGTNIRRSIQDSMDFSLTSLSYLWKCISSSMEKTPQEISRRAVNPKSWLVNIGSFFLFFLSDVAVRNQDEEDTAIRPRERRKGAQGLTVWPLASS